MTEYGHVASSGQSQLFALMLAMLLGALNIEERLDRGPLLINRSVGLDRALATGLVV